MKVQDEFVKAKVQKVDSLLDGLKNKYKWGKKAPIKNILFKNFKKID